MAKEILYKQRRPGFPKESVDAGSYRTLIEYVGLADDLRASSPNINTEWGDYIGFVTLAELEPLEASDYAILVVWVERKFDESSYEPGGGELSSTVHEIDWVDVQRPLAEHPSFRVGGGGSNALTSEDISQIEAWQKMPNPEYKKDYIFPLKPDEYKSSDASAGTDTLSANAQLFARGIQLGIEYWVDKCPVARKSETYLNGPGPTGTAGQKESPSGFPNLPSGYEWIKSGDRSVQSGGQSRWQRDQEWLGAKKVLIDVDDIFWTA